MLRLGLYYDLRNPTPWREPWHRRYMAILEQVAWAERELGFGSVWLSEHHFLPDGYAASTLTAAAAIAARTTGMRIGTNVLVLPVHHPLRVAEDAMMLQALSGGRFVLGVGLGYRQPEFPPFGTALTERRARTDEAITILRRAFTGQPFSHHGRFWAFENVTISPAPDDGGPELWVGALSLPGIERAARRGDGFLCALPEQIEAYVNARRAAGLGGPGRVATTRPMIIAADPEREAARIGDHLLYYVNQYIELGTFGPPDTIPRLTSWRDVIEHGHVQALDADGAVDVIAGLARLGPVEDVHWWTVFPGEAIDGASARLEYIATAVMPRLSEYLGKA
jgi:alkanesulfonate monooxygenase SsuD/methylene tetrahydromethanopterin reductase-like flavin-dependent oxidoreductase (luciferase family)